MEAFVKVHFESPSEEAKDILEADGPPSEASAQKDAQFPFLRRYGRVGTVFDGRHGGWPKE